MRGLVSAAALAAALLLPHAPAAAAVVSVAEEAALSATPVTVTVAGSTATFAFTAAATGYGPGAAVATGGSGTVSTLFGSVADFEAGASIDGAELFVFAAYASPAAIPFSVADDFIGLAFTEADGTHYGYAELDGPALVQFGYETSPRTPILTGAVSAVPEPATVVLMLGAMAGMLAARRRA